ncbi:MAG: hypothetical protein KC503_13165, partial [Myxococcales bacterium]|nr:hypothetical protein [Myxococcales bacterium]
MSGHEAKLAAALEAADVETISALLGGELGETERRALAKVLADFVPPWAREGAQDLRWREHAPYVDAITLARVGVQTFGELKKDWRDMLRVDAAAVLAIIRARRPSWLASWVTFLLERPGGWLSHAWRIVYVLVRERLVERPDHIGYLLGMIHGVKPPQAAREEESWDDRRARERRELADALRADPVLLEQELWRLFETEGTRDHQLDHDWVHALLQLAADGDLDRQRLLDESLAALARDFAQFKAAWYADLHRALEPTRDEQAARAERYLELCASRIPPTVAFALDVLLALDKDERLDPAGVLAYAPAALSAKAKKNALAALGLLERAARRKPALALDAARALLVALEHPAADVQRRALAAIAELVPQPAADDELLAGLLGAADVVSAALRDRVVALCGSAGAEAAARAEPPPAV